MLLVAKEEQSEDVWTTTERFVTMESNGLRVAIRSPVNRMGTSFARAWCVLQKPIAQLNFEFDTWDNAVKHVEAVRMTWENGKRVVEIVVTQHAVHSTAPPNFKSRPLVHVVQHAKAAWAWMVSGGTLEKFGKKAVTSTRATPRDNPWSSQKPESLAPICRVQVNSRSRFQTSVVQCVKAVSTQLVSGFTASVQM